MKKHSLLAALAVCTAVATAPSARATTPGTSTASAVRINVFEPPFGDDPGAKEFRTSVIPGGVVADGFMVMLENAAAGNVCSNWSDIVVFWDGTNFPSGGTGSSVTVISDPQSETGFNCGAGPLLFNAGALRPEYVGLPAALQNITEAQITGGAGANATAFVPEVVNGNSVSVTYAAGTSVYRVVSDVPALPPWGFALLGTTLAGAAVFLIRRRRPELSFPAT
jgi:hypothetical protein